MLHAADALDALSPRDSATGTDVVESTRGGSLIVLGTLTDLQGNTVAQAGTIFSLFEAQPATFRVDFDGYEIYGSERDGPYRLVDLEILDAGVGFVRADLVEDAHETAPYSWRDFGVTGGLPFVRGDANVDQNIDLSDAIVVLSSLFTGGDPLLCQDSADSNADGTIDLSDGLTIVNYLFLGITPTLELPFPECGQAADLGCEYYPYCY